MNNEVKFCKKCGGQLKKETNFCEKCGNQYITTDEPLDVKIKKITGLRQ